jgi:hypothetical protein
VGLVLLVIFAPLNDKAQLRCAPAPTYGCDHGGFSVEQSAMFYTFMLLGIVFL